MPVARDSTACKADIDELCRVERTDIGKAAALEDGAFERQLRRERADLRIGGWLSRLVVDDRRAAGVQRIDTVGAAFQNEGPGGSRDFPAGP